MAGTSTNGIEPVRRLKVSDSVAAQLEQLILRGDFKPGEKLPPERVLSEQFGVGRSSMREALRMVEASGLVRTTHGVGVFVTDSKAKPGTGLSELLMLEEFTVPELFEVRLALEGDATALAARRATATDAANLRRLIADASDPELSDEGFVKLDAELHRAIVKITQNGLLLRIMDSIRPLFLTYSYRVIELQGRRAVAHAGHAKIVEAIAAHHIRDARNAAVKHIREVEQDIVRHLQRPETER
jgi:GntR family transcriptional regulator, transcriptional repressor for pyruvate dehydrogenase complex